MKLKKENLETEESLGDQEQVKINRIFFFKVNLGIFYKQIKKGFKIGYA